MFWLQLIPDGKCRVATAMYAPNKRKIFKRFKKNTTHHISIWYVDVIEKVEFDPDGVAVFVDKYLDVIFTPQGDIKIDDMDELDEAYQSEELSKEQYESALAEGETIRKELCTDVKTTEERFNQILRDVRVKIAEGKAYVKPVLSV